MSLIAFAFVVYYAAAAIFYERQDESLRSTAQTVASAYVEELGEAQSAAKASQVVLAGTGVPRSLRRGHGQQLGNEMVPKFCATA